MDDVEEKVDGVEEPTDEELETEESPDEDTDAVAA